MQPLYNNNFRMFIIKTFGLCMSDTYGYKASSEVTLLQAQTYLEYGGQGGLHGWYKDDQGELVSSDMSLQLTTMLFIISHTDSCYSVPLSQYLSAISIRTFSVFIASVMIEHTVLQPFVLLSLYLSMSVCVASVMISYSNSDSLETSSIFLSSSHSTLFYIMPLSPAYHISTGAIPQVLSTITPKVLTGITFSPLFHITTLSSCTISLPVLPPSPPQSP